MSTSDIRRQTRQLLNGFAGQLAGRERGPDHDPEGKLRTPRRNSYDADDDPRAKPWSKIGDGSVGQGLAYREALIEVVEELHHQHSAELPRREIRERRARYDALSDELQTYVAGLEAPVGRMATIRQELAPLRAYLDRAEKRIRKIDIEILKALLKNLDFATGRLFPAIETIAARASVHRNSVTDSLRRLKAHGIIERVRRSVKTGNGGQFAPQREQTSNAYFFEHRQKMSSRVFQRYWRRVVAKLRRLLPARRLRPQSPPTAP